MLNKHHIVCFYEQKYKPNLLSLINQKYNLVTLTYTMHVFIHTIRFVEYNFLDNLDYLSFVKPELNHYQIHKGGGLKGWNHSINARIKRPNFYKN